ncbi:unnamed protein product [Paramecium octaurelia]|uniref:Myb-like domain-containing protein n=1 Tax=Paramecium octaurelia TaxID=43137 RepID=A0A8S1TT39_PAROT|nr:unnamed protein product [Paramecium octaurelia]
MIDEMNENVCILVFCQFLYLFLLFEHYQNLSFFLLKNLKSFEINVPKYFLFIRFEQQWFMNVFHPYFQFLTLQQWSQQQVMSDVQSTIKVEDGLDEQRIESKSTIQSVEQNQNQKKQIKKTRKKNSKKMYNNGHWTKKEHRLYLQFIETNKEIMMKSDMKKQEKIFKQMSIVIKSRSPSQCRSHHQKFNPF